jgi:ABC-type lipoprotein release transport system permease subunit
VTKTAPRLESFALISGGEITDGAMVLGIDPEHEDKLTKLKIKLAEGEYLEKDDSDIMLAKGLAEHIGAGIGDTIIVLGQGYHGVTAAGKYRVKGIVRYPTPDLNSSMSYLSITEAQRLFMAEGRITSLAIMIDRQKRLDKVTEELKTIFSDGYEVMTWEEMLPELVQSIETDNAGGVVMLGVIYMVIGFGMLGTILMMTLERNREFGMLMAVGMKRRRLRIIILLESVFLSFIGVIAGTVAGIPILIYMYHHPIPLTGDIAKMMESYGWEAIMPFSLEPMIFIWQAVTVLILAMIAALYPLWKISKLEPVTALRTG